MKLQKMYGWKEDLMYYIHLPKWILWALWQFITRDYRKHDDDWRDVIALAKGSCDAEVGRVYAVIKEEE